MLEHGRGPSSVWDAAGRSQVQGPMASTLDQRLYLPGALCVSVAQSCLFLCDIMDCNPPGSSVHGILQARVLEWVAMPFSRRYSRQGSNSCLFISCIGRQILYQLSHLDSPGSQPFKKPVIPESSYSATISPKLSAPASILALWSFDFSIHSLTRALPPCPPPWGGGSVPAWLASHLLVLRAATARLELVRRQAQLLCSPEP